MEYLADAVRQAFRLLVSRDPDFMVSVLVSLKVAVLSTTLAALAGVPFGMWVSERRGGARRFVITVLNTLMSLPTVVVGLMFYGLLSRRGPLGEYGLLYTQTAMVAGQFVLAFPILAGLTASAVLSLDGRIRVTACVMGANTRQTFMTFLREARYGLMAAVVAGFGRVFAEVGVSMMLGGNIRGYTRNITTTIALETSKGQFELGIALGMVLLTIALTINIFFSLLREKAK